MVSGGSEGENTAAVARTVKNAAIAVINTHTTHTGRRKAKPQSAGQHSAAQHTAHSTAHSTAQPLTDAGFPSYSLIVSRGRGDIIMLECILTFMFVQ